MARRSDKSEGYRARRLAARRSQRWGAYQNLVLYALAAVVAFGAVLGAVQLLFGQEPFAAQSCRRVLIAVWMRKPTLVTESDVMRLISL